MNVSEQKKTRILVVDDTKVNRTILEARLKEEGYEVTCAPDGRIALELLGLAQESPSPNLDDYGAILLDIMMPEIDGLEVLRKVRERFSSLELPVIMTTAKNESVDIVEALRAGANDYVTKPTDMGVLKARLETHLKLRHYHADLRRAHHSLVSAARAESIAHLAAGVAHEIRNPLAQIRMAAPPLRKLVGDDPGGRVLLDVLENAVDRADQVVARLMETSKDEALQVVPTDLNSLVTWSATVLEAELESHGIQCELRLAKDLPNARLSPPEMQQALIQVILNASQATEPGGTVTVTTRSRILESSPPVDSRSGNRLRKGDLVEEVVIEDNGPGVSEDKIGAIFDPFFTTKPTGAALGLGLTLVRKFMSLQGGHVTVANRMDVRGLRVTLTVAAARNLRTHV